ncbi:P-loop containing nucleoside triphosphate hydrolase [Sesbania bispinosa]|nr:P-loop containing nucleoside triphosphate hydrolase [Sesbania bispinosa]
MCRRLTRLWIAEGFVKEDEIKKDQTPEEVVEEYLGELIHRSLVKISDLYFDGSVRSCRVHDLMHAFITRKCEELNFCQAVENEEFRFHGLIRRLSIHKNIESVEDERAYGSVRSCIFRDLEELLNSTVFKFKEHKDQGDYEVHWGPLKHRNSDLERYSELKILKRMRRLGIIMRKVNGNEVCTAIKNMCHLCSLSIATTGDETDQVLEMQSLIDPPPCIQRLYLDGRLDNLPRWIPKLKNLVSLQLMWSRLVEYPLPLLKYLPELGEHLLKTILESFYEEDKNKSAVKEISEMVMSMDNLIRKIREYLQANSYVIVSDDFWEQEFWVDVEHALSTDDNNGKIIFTTRDRRVVDFCKSCASVFIHEMKPLPFEDGLKLFHMKAFQFDTQGCPDELMKLSKDFVEKCEGVPLANVAISGLLSTKNKIVSDWQKKTYSFVDSGGCFVKEDEINKDQSPEEVVEEYLVENQEFRFHGLTRRLSIDKNIESVEDERAYGSVRSCIFRDLEELLKSTVKLKPLLSSFKLLEYKDQGDYEVHWEPLKHRNSELERYSGIECLTTLHSLTKIDLTDGNGVIKELKILKRMRRLGIIMRKVNGNEVCTAIKNMCHLCSLSIATTGDETDQVLEMQSLIDPPPCIQRLYLDGRLDNLPRWILKLKNLVSLRLMWSRLVEYPLPLLKSLSELGEHLLKTILESFYEEDKNKSVVKDIREMVMSMDNLIKKIREYLQAKSYVIVSDDIWEQEFWVDVEHALSTDDNNGKIILTTRDRRVVDFCKSCASVFIHEMKPLSFEDGLKLFHMKAFQFDPQGCPDELMKLSKDFVEKCEGVPLANVAISGLLSTKNKIVSDWKKKTYSFVDSGGCFVKEDEINKDQSPEEVAEEYLVFKFKEYKDQGDYEVHWEPLKHRNSELERLTGCQKKLTGLSIYDIFYHFPTISASGVA